MTLAMASIIFLIGTRMQLYKVIQKVYNRTAKHTDDIRHMNYNENFNENDVAQYAIRYLTSVVSELQFPGKSYAVAILYSYLIEKHFKVPFFESLKDPDLFDGTDKYFRPYQESPQIYDLILEAVGEDIGKSFQFSQVQKTHEYFLKEFGIES